MLAIRLPAEVENRLEALAQATGRLGDLRCIGETLKSSRLGAFWKYRVGGYRIVASIEVGGFAHPRCAHRHPQGGLPEKWHPSAQAPFR